MNYSSVAAAFENIVSYIDRMWIYNNINKVYDMRSKKNIYAI